MKYLVLIIALLAPSMIHADPYKETRCCVDIVRDANGNIYRNQVAKREFRRRWPCPTGATLYEPCEGWQIDHVIPLANGGRDAVSNMQWLPEEIKTCAGTLCKDRWERKIYK